MRIPPTSGRGGCRSRSGLTKRSVGRGIYLKWSTRPAAEAPPRSVNPEPMDKSSQNRRAHVAPPLPSPAEVESKTPPGPPTHNPVVKQGGM